MTEDDIKHLAENLRPSILATLKQSWMEGDWFRLTDQVIGHYAVKAAVCSLAFKEIDSVRLPMDIVEIGTRCGYSLACFNLVRPGAAIACWDGATDDDSKQCLEHAEQLIKRCDISAMLVRENTEGLDFVVPAVFAHVDGDHSFNGALRDLRLCSKSRTILADDTDNQNVRKAVDCFLQESGRTAIFVDDGLRVAAVIS